MTCHSTNVHSQWIKGSHQVSEAAARVNINAGFKDSNKATGSLVVVAQLVVSSFKASIVSMKTSFIPSNIYI